MAGICLMCPTIRNKLKLFIIEPTSIFYYRWLYIISLAVTYNLVVVVARAVFVRMQTEHIIVWIIIDCISDAVYIADTVIQFRTAMFEQGILILDTSKLTGKYFKSFNCWLTIASVIPTDLLYIFIGTQAAFVRANRLLRLGRLFEAKSKIESETTYPNMFRIGTLAFKILLAIHWCTCFYYQFSNWSGLGSTWFVFSPDPNNNSTLFDYMSCCYWSTMMLLTLVEMPKPSNVAEYLFTITILLVGVMFVAYIVGDVGNAVSKVSAQRSAFQAKLDAIKRYLVHRKIDKILEADVLKWFEYLKSEDSEGSFASDDDEVLEILPRSLQIEINSSVHAATLNRVNLFKDCDKGLINQLVLKLKPIVFGPRDYVCRKGDIGREMYILKRGKLAVVSENGEQTFALLSEGAVFGEISLLNIIGNKNGNRRTASIRSVGYSDLFYLSKEDLWEALKEYPETAESMLETGRQLLKKDNLIDVEVAQEAFQDKKLSRSDLILNLGMKLDRAHIGIVRLLAEISSMRKKLEQRIDIMNMKLRI